MNRALATVPLLLVACSGAPSQPRPRPAPTVIVALPVQVPLSSEPVCPEMSCPECELRDPLEYWGDAGVLQ